MSRRIGIGNNTEMLSRRGCDVIYKSEAEALNNIHGGDILIYENKSPLMKSFSGANEYNVKAVAAVALPDGLTAEEIAKADYLEGEGFTSTEIAKALGKPVADIHLAKAFSKVFQ